MKAILVIDMPEEYMGSNIDVKLYGRNHTIHERYVNKVKPLPQKMKHEDEIDYEYGYIDGRNELIDEIMGETE